MKKTLQETGFEPVLDMSTEELRDMVKGYVGVADRLKLVEMLTACRDLFFDDEVI